MLVQLASISIAVFGIGIDVFGNIIEAVAPITLTLYTRHLEGMLSFVCRVLPNMTNMYVHTFSQFKRMRSPGESGPQRMYSNVRKDAALKMLQRMWL